MIIRIFIIILTMLFFQAQAKENKFFNEAKKLYEEKKYQDAKFLFQKNIVYDPKHASSYLYLAKIFKIEEEEVKEEKNLNTTLLLDPQNEEAIYLLIDIELKRSNFSKAKELNSNFKKICSTLCSKLSSIENRLKEFDKKDAS